MALTNVEIKNAKPKDKPYKLTDGRGLYLEIVPNGSKYWRMKYSFSGKERRLALGVYPDVSLKDARDKHHEARRQIANGIDPADLRRQQRFASRIRSENTFEALALEWWENKRDEWIPSHADRIIGYIRKDLFPALGSRPLVEIEPPDILHALRKVEKRGALDVVARELQYCKAIFRYAIQTGRAKVNPATELTGALKSRRSKHRPSLKVSDLPQFYERLKESTSSPITKAAIRLTILTFMRPGEIRTARWCDFDIENKEWRVPAELMKMRTEHIVPLSRQVLDLLEELRPLTGRFELLFPSERNRRAPMSENTMNQCINRMGYQGIATPHGFRATASSLLNEKGFNRDAIERQLSHMERNQVRAAYVHHAEYLDQRREMMQWWADYLEAIEMGSKEPAAKHRIGFLTGQLKVSDDFNQLGNIEIAKTFKGEP